jgi:hypothetical protein
MLVYLQSDEPLLEAGVLLLFRAPLVRLSWTDLGGKSYSGLLAPVLPVSSLRSLPAFTFSGVSRLTEYLSLGHSSGVRLRQ